jgi:hypothetical protein
MVQDLAISLQPFHIASVTADDVLLEFSDSAEIAEKAAWRVGVYKFDCKNGIK